MSLDSRYYRLSLYLNHHLLPPENSAPGVAGDYNDGEPMLVGEKEDEQNSKASIDVDKVEERMRDRFIQNKRPKRTLSHSVPAMEHRRNDVNEGLRSRSVAAEFDPQAAKLRTVFEQWTSGHGRPRWLVCLFLHMSFDKSIKPVLLIADRAEELLPNVPFDTNEGSSLACQSASFSS